MSASLWHKLAGGRSLGCTSQLKRKKKKKEKTASWSDSSAAEAQGCLLGFLAVHDPITATKTIASFNCPRSPDEKALLLLPEKKPDEKHST